MTILDEIIEHRKAEMKKVDRKKDYALFEQSEHFERTVYSFNKFVCAEDRSGVIAEFKRQSPSKGIINDKVTPEEITKGYADAGASVLSVLTNTKYFGGTVDDLKAARKVNTIPILRKEFIVDEYQILEAKAIGADLILLIAEALKAKEVKQLSEFAQSIGLEVLMEINDLESCNKICPTLNAVGVNNRDLRTFNVDINRSLELFNHIPDEFVKISESGLSKAENVIKLKEAGFHGFLMGEAFMKTDNPAKACAEFIKEAKLL